MALPSPIRVVLDTNVVFEGLTNEGGSCGLIINLWRTGLLRACVSDTLIYEYEDVFSRKLSKQRWEEITLVIDDLLDQHSDFTAIYFSWRPASPDPGDDHVINCALNANAPIITSNIRDFRQARQKLGLQVLTPTELLELLTREA